MSKSVLLLTDRPAFEEAWRSALERAGLHAQPTNPDALSEAIREGSLVVIDGACAVFDEDELLAHAGLARALKATCAIALPDDDRFEGIADLLDDLCPGLIARGARDATRIATTLARRADRDRSRRFEYLAVSPRPGELLAILADGTAALLPRPVTRCRRRQRGRDRSRSVTARRRRRSLLANGHEVSLRASALGLSSPSQRPSAPPTNGHGAIAIDGVRLGARLRELRVAAGLTQAELARRTGIHRPEHRARRSRPPHAVARNARAFGLGDRCVDDHRARGRIGPPCPASRPRSARRSRRSPPPPSCSRATRAPAASRVFLVQRHARSASWAACTCSPAARSAPQTSLPRCARASRTRLHVRCDAWGDGVDAGRGFARTVAAVRETFEEAGVLLGVERATADARARLRRRLLGGRSVCDVARRNSRCRCNSRSLEPLSRWITPECGAGRFDTSFFLARAPHEPGRRPRSHGSGRRHCGRSGACARGSGARRDPTRAADRAHARVAARRRARSRPRTRSRAAARRRSCCRSSGRSATSSCCSTLAIPTIRCRPARSRDRRAACCASSGPALTKLRGAAQTPAQ